MIIVVEIFQDHRCQTAGWGKVRASSLGFTVWIWRRVIIICTSCGSQTITKCLQVTHIFRQFIICEPWISVHILWCCNKVIDPHTWETCSYHHRGNKMFFPDEGVCLCLCMLTPVLCLDMNMRGTCEPMMTSHWVITTLTTLECSAGFPVPVVCSTFPKALLEYFSKVTLGPW